MREQNEIQLVRYSVLSPKLVSGFTEADSANV